MNYRIILTILKKELLETLRDRRTLFAMIGIPIILYPAIFIIMSQFTIIQQSKLESQISNIAIIENSNSELTTWLDSQYSQENIEKTDNKTSEEGEDNNQVQKFLKNIEIVSLDDTLENEIKNAIEQDNGKLAEILKNNNLKAIIVTKNIQISDLPTGANSINNLEVEIRYDNTVPASSQARSRFYDVLKAFGAEMKSKRLSELGVNDKLINPVSITTNDIAPPEKTAGTILGRILPMLMIMSLAIAAFYPALDLTAGEKERGTFETLLSTPVRKTEIVTGKFLAIFTLAMITASLSLASMALTIAGQLGQMANAMGDVNSPLGALSISPLTVIVMLMILMPMAFFICSVMMSIALFARNFREAQHYVTPFYLGITLPAIAASMPTVELNTFTMLLPIVNVALLFKELLIGNFVIELITGVFISISGWALLALTISVRLFQSEQLILSQEKGVALSLKRSQIPPSQTPSMGMGLGLFAFCLLGLFYIGSYFQSKSLISGIIITEWLVILAPVLLILWYYKINLRKTLSLKLPKWYEPILSIVLILASNIIIMRLGIEMSRFMPLPEVLNELAKALIGDDTSWANTLKLIFAIAVSAAVCEEALFRGPVLSGLLKPGRSNQMPAVVITAFLFAIMHLSVYRLMPTFLLGIVLGYLTWRSGSIFNSMIAHFVNNAIPVLILNDKLPKLAKWLEQFEGETVADIKPMPLWLILGAIAVIVSVVIIFEKQAKERSQQ